MCYSPPTTNQEILRSLRYTQEFHHRLAQEHFSGSTPGPGLLILPLCLPISDVELERIQHSCNKSIAIYTITPPLLPPSLCPHTNRMAWSKDSSDRDEMIFSIYKAWFRNHNVDIGFGNFPAKMIRIEIPFEKQRPGIENIIRKHKAWCDHVDASLPSCGVKRDAIGRELETPAYKHIGCFDINRKQNQHFNLRPLFRALVMIVDHDASLGEEKVVHLIRTNLPAAKLSAPIPFYSITPKLQSNRSSDYHGVNAVTTNLFAAMSFIATLETREANAFPDSQPEPGVIDELGATLGYHT